MLVGLATDTTVYLSRRGEVLKVNKLTFTTRASDSSRHPGLPGRPLGMPHAMSCRSIHAVQLFPHKFQFLILAHLGGPLVTASVAGGMSQLGFRTVCSIFPVFFLYSFRKRSSFLLVQLRIQVPHGGLRPFRQTLTCLARSSLGPYVVQLWSRNARNCKPTRPACSTVWSVHSPHVSRVMGGGTWWVCRACNLLSL